MTREKHDGVCHAPGTKMKVGLDMVVRDALRWRGGSRGSKNGGDWVVCVADWVDQQQMMR